MRTEEIPYIDPNVEHVGLSRLRQLNAEKLRANTKALVFHDNDQPLAVLLTYEQFLRMQNQIQAVLRTMDMLTDEDELAAAQAGLEDAREGRTRALSEIRRELKSQR